MEITVIFSENKRPILRFFRRVLNIPASHCSLGLKKDDEELIFHSTFKGTVYTDRQYFLTKNDIVAEFKIKTDLSEEFLEIEKTIGSKYDEDAANILQISEVVPLLRWFLIKIKAKPKYYCSNLVRRLDYNNKLKSWSDIDKDWTRLIDLYNACIKNKYKEFERII
jgi:hypothetical protein